MDSGREHIRTSTADLRRESDATALPPPPKLAHFDSMPRSNAFTRPATFPAPVTPAAPMTPAAAVTPDAAAPQVAAGPVRRGSNPLFPRVLPEQGFDLFSAVESYQNNLIRQAMERTGGNKNKAAQLLGLNRTTLVEMIRRRGL